MKNIQQKQEPQKITLGFLLGWIVGSLVLLTGVILLIQSPASGLLFLLAAIVILPPSNNYIRTKFNIVFSGFLKFLIFIVLIGIGGAILPPVNPSIAPEPSTTKNQDVNVVSTPVVENIPTPPQKAEKTYQQVFTFNGNGAKKSEPFTIIGDRFKIAYDCSGSLCQAYLYEVGTSYPVDVFMNNAGSTKDETIEYKNGEFYIQSNSLGSFKMTIYDYK